MANTILTRLENRVTTNKGARTKSIIGELVKIVEDTITRPIKEKFKLTPATLTKNKHFNNIVGEMNTYTIAVYKRFEMLSDSDLRAQLGEIKKIASLDVKSSSFKSLKRTFDLLGLSETSGILKVTITEFPQLVVSCPGLLTAGPKHLKSTLEKVFNQKRYTSNLEKMAPPTSSLTSGEKKALHALVAILIIEIVAAYIIMFCKLMLDFIAACAAAVATGGITTAAVVLVVVKDVVGFAAVVCVAIIAFFVEKWAIGV